ncbi:hypothetical protein F8M41_017205 [Gigaspora margarita]|uniref:Uncharacterized protein n=1 Tax=Gigaspora margarita TaxID=4874 RepID=A0A8H4B2W0_GIGMA|nr:hypothetical protein F8M41_017205 [Gigaspora margarita]
MINFFHEFNIYLWSLSHTLISIIKSQDQLRRFRLVCDEDYTEFYGIISALDSQKNSLQEVILEYCNYSIEFEILKECKKLEILRIKYCNFSKLLNILDCKLSTLDIIDYQIDASNIVQILEKSGILLQRLKLESYKIFEESILLEALKCCPNIIYLSISSAEICTQLVELIGNLQKLQFLTLWFDLNTNEPEEEFQKQIKHFAKILPLTLQYLDLKDVWIYSYIDILLNYCNAPLKKLIINRLDNVKHIKALIEFCSRNRTLNYVGLQNYSNLDNNIKNEVRAYVALVPYNHIVVN